MKKILFKLIMRIVSGVIDTITPNIQNSLKDKEFNPKTNKQHTKIDWVRLSSSFIVFILLLLNFLHLIDITEVLKAVTHELQSILP